MTLIDTDGKGLDGITENSIVSGSETYPVDIIIFATGYRALFAGSPAEKANMTVIGRNGVSMSEEWARSGPSTLHGIIDANFPNLFLCGPWQASFGPNYLFSMDTFAHHSGYIIAEARRKAGGRPFSVAPTYSAAESWGTQILQNSLPLTPLSGCTLGYFNGEGSLLEMPMIKARSGIWGRGIEDFVGILDAWREEGSMDGMEVQT